MSLEIAHRVLFLGLQKCAYTFIVIEHGNVRASQVDQIQ
jgi:hypothetical protein